MGPDYRLSIDAARQRIAFLRQQQAQIEKEIAMLERHIKDFEDFTNGNNIALHYYFPSGIQFPYMSLQEMAGIKEDSGLTDAIRVILFNSTGRPLPPTEIRNLLVQTGHFDGKPNLLANIHQTLTRGIGKWVKEIPSPGGKLYCLLPVEIPRYRSPLTPPAPLAPPGAPEAAPPNAPPGADNAQPPNDSRMPSPFGRLHPPGEKK